MALRAAREMRPEFLLTDVQMPGMNGVDLAVQVADEFPACEILLFSGHATGVDMESARKAGHDFRLMEKPIHPDNLLRYISGCLEGERGSNGSAESPDVWMWGMMPSRAN
jgi:YesN/AraC family two-component response regulator